MPLSDMPRKLKDYFAGTRGQVRFVIIIKLERQPPPRKRKRVESDDEDAEDADSDTNLSGQESSQDTHEAGAREPTPLSDPTDEDPTLPPPVGSLIRGVFWVYGCQRTATPTNPNSSRIIALETEQVTAHSPPSWSSTDTPSRNSTRAAQRPRCTSTGATSSPGPQSHVTSQTKSSQSRTRSCTTGFPASRMRRRPCCRRMRWERTCHSIWTRRSPG